MALHGTLLGGLPIDVSYAIQQVMHNSDVGPCTIAKPVLRKSSARARNSFSIFFVGVPRRALIFAIEDFC